ncbi:uncharacterized protein LOC133315980 [Gastrolobium bilobum]|uniref:uncharacterized protein LOC133315980 n=1 Tax=Gastrolobium bilobum TaxID=150636 RepID=UPI002AB1C854|nr:uncharacterized protein LOC133315980 [Gastrolobium bilobum]
MEHFTKTLLFIASISCILVHTNAVPTTRTPQARVWALCKPTTNPVLCYKTILPRAFGKFNIYKALEVEVIATQNQVKRTSSLIALLLAKQSLSKSLRESLTTCQEQYSNMIDDIDITIKEVARRNVVEARFKFSAVLSYQASCNDEFIDGPSPIANEAQGVYDLGGNSLDLMKAIEDREARRESKKHSKPSSSSSSSPAVPNPCKGVIGICG